ncbi:putative nucleotidyltransferase substrate binding domain-containing protein [Azospirillum argentinense]|uniref:Nucleotidyltransferase substrate binding domain-containing protein n=1 Tax=Azospirillum argentinense TaxID=2970906 RepID=A0A5B0KYT3_9PROT|nr:putative nucleotidyltransferase substrate binding domain-containing protein [Azospirillum argentinense]KAA1057877.1 putative signal-transduction protein containing cAMP-binding and CBS domains [Azospirillum argentinense]
MSDAFDFSVPPFDRLTPEQRQRLAAALDLGVYARDGVILSRDEPADCLFVVRQGLVHERRGGEVVAVYGAHDSFDLQALFSDGQARSFVAAEDTLCDLVPRPILLELAHENAAFGAVIQQEFADRLSALANERSNRETAALTMARIREAYLRPPVFVEAGASLRDAAAAMKRDQASSVLVRDGDPKKGGRVGILTGTDLRDLVVLEGRPVDSPVGPLARYELLALDRDDLLFNALILMTKHSVRRLVITEQGAVVGLLEQTDLLAVLSNHSQVVALKVDRAATPEDLGRASQDIVGLIRTLHGTGVKVSFIADLVTELNRKIFRRLFELLAPPDLLANSCLIVMGSEGRGEQLLKTDQDNGLILRDGYVCPSLSQVTDAFTRHLVDFGYPPCPGRIMVSNPDWTRPLALYKDSLFHWIHRPDEAAQMNLAIFYDAAAVAGDASLLAEAKGYLLGRLQDNQMFFTAFARPALAFDTPSGLFGGLFERRRSEAVDIKKAGIFPIVHGVRALALEKHMAETNTTERIWALADQGVLDRGMAGELADAFTFLSTLRLKAGLDGSVSGTQTDNLVRTESLGKLDRDQFKDCLALVKKFKELLAYHFHLNH